jgi:hypothetical protein
MNLKRDGRHILVASSAEHPVAMQGVADFVIPALAEPHWQA